jgi:MoxR-like ATPase
MAIPVPTLIDGLRRALSSVIRGKDAAIDLLLVGLLAQGHVLIEDVPGVGKTTLAKALARALSLDFARVQCTPDLLPSDILGSNILDPRAGTLAFHKGPVFTQILLVDETNRASPRTQSGLLEAMNEQQVTVDGITYPLPRPFFVIATQNPVDFQGTYPLPVAQLDRFLVRVRIGYPLEEDELNALFERRLADPLLGVESVADLASLVAAQTAVQAVRVEPDVGRYLLRLVRATRDHKEIELGVSTRGALALFRASQAQAVMQGRDWVSPEDVQALAPSVLGHRLTTTAHAGYGGKTPEDIVSSIVEALPVPT